MAMGSVAEAGIATLASERESQPLSRRGVAVAQIFGVGYAQPAAILPDLGVRFAPGHIVAYVGPSGSGKTTALRRVAHRCAYACDVQKISFPEGKALVDAVAPQGSLADALELLSLCALGEAPLWLRGYETLSTGEQFRARIARALGARVGVHANGGAGGMLLIDEFGSGLHRRAARALAHNLRRVATRRGVALAVATVHDELLTDLQPDTVVRLDGAGGARVHVSVPRRRALSLCRRLHIVRGTRRDWDAFSPMHYRSTEELGFVDQVYVLRAGLCGEAVGIVVYSYPPAELTLRNQATRGVFKGNLRKLNQEVRILRRLVVHPDLRGCGLGHRLVRRTLPLAGTRYVECLAAMGAVNPVFERAGMTRVGVCAPPKSRQRTLAKLNELGVDPLGPGFETEVCCRPAVRELVAAQVQQWYRATTGAGEQRVARQSPQMIARIFRGLVGMQPVYYLWERPDGG